MPSILGMSPRLPRRRATGRHSQIDLPVAILKTFRRRERTEPKKRNGNEAAQAALASFSTPAITGESHDRASVLSRRRPQNDVGMGLARPLEESRVEIACRSSAHAHP
jgi:hypothetical protein